MMLFPKKKNLEKDNKEVYYRIFFQILLLTYFYKNNQYKW